MREEYGTVRIYVHIEIPIYSRDKMEMVRRTRRTLHAQEGVTKVEATDLYQSFMNNNRHRFQDEDVIFCVWQAEPSYISLTRE